MKFTVSADQAKQRLDKFLTAELTDSSRSGIQKLIKSGGVVVNGRSQSAHYALKANDEITVTAAQPAAAGKPTPAGNALVPHIIADEDDFLIIDKPDGL